MLIKKYSKHNESVIKIKQNAPSRRLSKRGLTLTKISMSNSVRGDDSSETEK